MTTHPDGPPDAPWDIPTAAAPPPEGNPSSSPSTPPMRKAWTDIGFLIALAATGMILLGVGYLGAQALGLPLHPSLAVATVLAFLPLSLALTSTGYVTLATGRFTALGAASAIAFGALLAIASNALMVALTIVSPALAELAALREEFILDILRPGEPAFLFTVIIVVSILPGFMEELFFRGALREFFASRSRYWRIWAIGIAFAAMHADAVGFLSLVLVGVCLGWMAERTGGWLLPAIAHAAHNGLSILLANVAASPGLVEESDDPSLLTLAAVALVAALLIWTSARFIPALQHRKGITLPQ